MTKRPNFRGEFLAFMRARGIRSMEELGNELRGAGYDHGKHGKLGKSKVSWYINDKDGVPDHFLRWVDRVYGIDDSWRFRLALAEWEDRLERPLNGGRKKS